MNSKTDDNCEVEKGIPVKLEYSEKGSKKTITDSVELFLTVNAMARRHGVGRIDIVSQFYKVNVRVDILIVVLGRKSLHRIEIER